MPTPSARDPLDVLLLERYLADECTPRERAAVEAWVAAEPSRGAELEILRRAQAAWEDLSGAAPTATAWTRMQDRVAASRRRGEGRTNELSPGGRMPPPTASPMAAPHSTARTPQTWPRGMGGGNLLKTRRLVPLGVAFATGAGAALLVAVGVQGRWRMSRPNAHEYVTAAGQRETVTLSDGTRFTLAPSGTLRISRDYGVSGRTVSLDGEAYFSVVHDARHPFVVRAANAVATDLGTAFDVRAYSGDSAVRIAVRDGRVSVCGRPTGRMPTASADCGQAELLAHDVASVDASGHLAVSRGVDVASVFAWMQGRLVFDDTPLRDVVRELDRTFDLDIAVADSTLLGRRITGAFSDERVNDVLDAVTFAVGARYERAARRVIIRRAVTGAEHDRLNGSGPGMRIARAADPRK